MRQQTELVGVVNVNEDSFYVPSRYNEPNAAITQVTELFNQGVSMVDIGAESTAPNATPIDHTEEMRRLRAVASSVTAYGESISIDTYHPETVEELIRSYGRFTLNATKQAQNPGTRELVIKNQMPIIICRYSLPEESSFAEAHAHRETTPEVVDGLAQAAMNFIDAGLHPDLITLDPWIGVGKTAQTNWELLRIAELLPGFKTMVGFSNKRFLKTDPETGELQPGVTELDQETLERYMRLRNYKAAKIAVNAGAKYLRVHDPSLYNSLIR